VADAQLVFMSYDSDKKIQMLGGPDSSAALLPQLFAPYPGAARRTAAKKVASKN